MPRFACLRHERGPDDVHWDLLLAPGPTGRLWTYRLPAPPDLAPGESLPARRIADHRRRYLSFEGEIGRGLGRVDAIDRGTWTPRSDPDPAGMELLLEGERLRGLHALRDAPGPGEELEFLRLPDPDGGRTEETSGPRVP